MAGWEGGEGGLGKRKSNRSHSYAYARERERETVEEGGRGVGFRRSRVGGERARKGGEDVYHSSWSGKDERWREHELFCVFQLRCAFLCLFLPPVWCVCVRVCVWCVLCVCVCVCVCVFVFVCVCWI